MATTRESIPARTRFEIFKRDGFRCIYCGQSPPTVTLEIEHIIAVANGGQNDACNLATACRKCNIGKGAVPLTSLPVTQQENLHDCKNRVDQMKAFAQLAIDQREAEDASFWIVSRAWVLADGDDPDQYMVNELKETAIRRFIKLLPLSQILEAVEIVFTNKPDSGDYSQFKYFCGICWRKIKRTREEAAVSKRPRN